MVLCEKLGMTINELESRMNWDEFQLWVAFYNLRQMQEEKARQK